VKCFCQISTSVRSGEEDDSIDLFQYVLELLGNMSLIHCLFI
jgi:hypothetical protein